ncbi:MAG: phospholipase [Actinomycetota bacterium]|nr:phospholipase [Actinomycetota bacterium]
MSPEPVARPHPEPVVLDIGGDTGALIVYAEAEFTDTPIEVSPAGADGEKFHQHVLERPIPSGTSYAAVFDKITAGSYTLWLHGQPRVRDCKIAGGTVTEVDWRADVGGPPSAA